MRAQRRGAHRIRGLALRCAAVLVTWSPALAASQASLPIRLDHHRILIMGRVVGPRIDRDVALWLDTGNPELWITERLARELVPAAVRVLPDTLILTGVLRLGGETLDLAHAGVARVIRDPSIAPGLPALMNVPASLLREKEVEIDYPGRRVRLGAPESLRLTGDSIDAFVAPGSGLLSIPVDVGLGRVQMGLDIGASASFVRASRACGGSGRAAGDVATGAFGSANLFGDAVEQRWRVVELAELRLRGRSGGRALSRGLAVCLDDPSVRAISARGETDLQGLIGGNLLDGLRVGLSPARRLVVVRRVGPAMSRAWPGVTLHPLPSGAWEIGGISVLNGRPLGGGAERGDTLELVEGTPVHGLSMGAVWSLLAGGPRSVVAVVVRRRGARVRLSLPRARLQPRRLR